MNNDKWKMEVAMKLRILAMTMTRLALILSGTVLAGPGEYSPQLGEVRESLYKLNEFVDKVSREDKLLRFFKLDPQYYIDINMCFNAYGITYPKGNKEAYRIRYDYIESDILRRVISKNQIENYHTLNELICNVLVAHANLHASPIELDRDEFEIMREEDLPIFVMDL